MKLQKNDSQPKDRIDFNSEDQIDKISKKNLSKAIKTKGKHEAEIKAKVIGFVMQHPKKLIFSLVYMVGSGLVANTIWIIKLVKYFL